jgi:uncharacterized protein (TIGR02646 family)
MKIDRIKVYQKYDGHCAYCGTELSLKQMHVDHIRPQVSHGTDDFENLNPSCKYCNNHKSHAGLETWRGYLKSLMNTDYEDRLFRSRTKMHVAVNFKTVTIAKWDGLFYFEKYQQ